MANEVQVHYCWQCKRDVPMLDADEAARVIPLYHEGMRALKRVRTANAQRERLPHQTLGDQLGDLKRDELRCWAPMLDELERLTGIRFDDPGSVHHHQLALFGPPCRACRRLLRTAKAKHCAACGADR